MKFQPGQSGNPAGRKPGTGKAAKLRAGLAECLPAVIERVRDAALEGDMAAARLLLERCIPVLRPVSAPAPLAELPDGSLAEQGQFVLRSLAEGRVGVHEACALLGAIGSHARTIEAVEVEARLSALEAAARGGAP